MGDFFFFIKIFLLFFNKYGFNYVSLVFYVILIKLFFIYRFIKRLEVLLIRNI